MFKIRQKLGLVFDHCAPAYLWKHCQKIVKFDQIEHFGLFKKAAVVSNFCLIGIIHHNFLVPKMIELGSKAFMLIQTQDLHRERVVEGGHRGYRRQNMVRVNYIYESLDELRSTYLPCTRTIITHSFVMNHTQEESE